jgi:hypothetical protein
MGRPSLYTEELASEICRLIAEGRTTRQVCSIEGMPSLQTLFRWFTMFPEFNELYARAKEVQIEVLASEVLELSDTCRIGEKTKSTRLIGTSDGVVITLPAEEVTTGDMVERARLQVDSRKWLLSKLAPKKYGDRLELAGDKEAPLTITVKRVDIP